MKFEKQLLFLICIFAAAQAFANNEIVVIAKLKQVATPLVHGECPRSLDTNSLRYSLGMSGCIEPSGNCYKGILSLTGNETINGSLIVTGTTTLSDLTVTGPTSFTGPTTFSILTVTGNASVAGLTTLATLTVTGNVSSTGLTTLSNLTVTGNAHVAGTMIVDGTITGNSSGTNNTNSLTVTNDAVVDGNVQAGSYSVVPLAPGTPGVLGFGGLLAWGQIYYTTSGISTEIASGNPFPLATAGICQGVTPDTTNYLLTVANAGTYLIYFYATCTDPQVVGAPPILQAVIAINNAYLLAGGSISGTYGTSSSYGRCSSGIGAVIANLNAGDTISLINGGVKVAMNGYTLSTGDTGITANLIVARIA